MPRKKKIPAPPQVDPVEFIGLLDQALAVRLSIAQCFTFVSGATILLSTVVVLTDICNGTNYHKDKSKLASFRHIFYFFCAITLAYQHQRVSHNKLIEVAKKIKPVLQDFNQDGVENIRTEVTKESAAREVRMLQSNPRQVYYYSNRELVRLVSEIKSIENEALSYFFYFLTYYSWGLETLSFFAELLQSVYRRLMLVQIDHLCIQFDEMFKKVPFIFSDQLTSVCEKVSSHMGGHSLLGENDQVEIVENIFTVVRDRFTAFKLDNGINPDAHEYFMHDIEAINKVMQTMVNSLIMQFFYYGHITLGLANNFFAQAKNSLFFHLGPLRIVLNVFILISSILPLFALVNQLPMVFSSFLNSLNRRLINGCRLISFNVSSERSLFFINKTYDEAKVAFVLLEYLGCYISRLPVRYRGRKKLYFLPTNNNPFDLWWSIRRLDSVELTRLRSFVEEKESMMKLIKSTLMLANDVNIYINFDLSTNRIICKLNFSMFSVVKAAEKIDVVRSHWLFRHNEQFGEPVSDTPLLLWEVRTMNTNLLANFIAKHKPKSYSVVSNYYSKLPVQFKLKKRSRKVCQDPGEIGTNRIRVDILNKKSHQADHVLEDDQNCNQVKFIINNENHKVTYVCNRDAICVLFRDSVKFKKSYIKTCFNLLQHKPFKKIIGSGKQFVGSGETFKGADLAPHCDIYTRNAVKLKWHSGQRVVFRQSSVSPSIWYATAFYSKGRSGVATCKYPELTAGRPAMVR